MTFKSQIRGLSGWRVGTGDNGEVKFPRLARIAWCSITILTLATLLGFVVLDPEQNWLLACCAAANVFLILWMVYKLYRWQLLLSPMASVVIGPGLILYYSWGNLGARIAGEGRFGSNWGSLEYYPQAALLSTAGLAIFALFIFGLFPKQSRYAKLRYNDLCWKPWQPMAAALVAIALLVYLSSKYAFHNGYFQDVASDFDRWLAASQYFCVVLAVVSGVSVMARATRTWELLMGVAGVILPILIALGLRSRTSMGTTILLAVICLVSLQPRRVWSALTVGAVSILLIFALGTVVKTAGATELSASIMDNLFAISASNLQEVREQNLESGTLDLEYRMAGFELPAAVLMGMDQGAEPLYGAGIYNGMISALPGFLRPEGTFSERIAIYEHFRSYGLLYGDSTGIPLTSGLADWGLLAGPLIYGLIAAFCLLMWRLVQSSPRLFVAYLMVGAGPGDLVWENALFSIRGIVFAWMILWVLSFFLMPRWQLTSRNRQQTDAREPHLQFMPGRAPAYSLVRK